MRRPTAIASLGLESTERLPVTSPFISNEA